MKTKFRTGRSLMTKVLFAFFMTTCALALSLNVAAQSNSLKSYEMTVKGGSNVHDWTMKALNGTSVASFVNKPGALTLNSLEFTVPVKGLKSESDLMDTRTYNTLKSDKFQNITYKLVSAVVTPTGNNHYTIKATGNLTISGATRQVVMNTNCVVNPDKTITVNGQQKLKMSEFQIKPPSFLFGAMKVADEVTISFNLKYNG
ncbi:MAG: YceI family protein [Candidatus Dadabacteria bacterium]